MKPIISDDTVELLIVAGIVVIGMPIWLVNHTWRWLRTGTFPYP